MKFLPAIYLSLSVLFGALVYLSPWFSVPSVALIAALIIERWKTQIDLSEERELLKYAQSELRLAITKEDDIKARFFELQSQVDNLRTAQNMRFQK